VDYIRVDPSSAHNRESEGRIFCDPAVSRWLKIGGANLSFALTQSEASQACAHFEWLA
jgi:hypothetical protein